jgi:hypothetical protein
MYRVSRRVNSVQNDGPDLVEPIDDAAESASGADPGKAVEPSTAEDEPDEPTLFPESAVRISKGR